MILDNCYASYINLAHRTDRRAHMEKELARVGINAERTWGILPAGHPEAKYDIMRQRTPGAIGCYLAQMSVMKEAMRQNKHALVMEDDLIFCSDLHDRLAIFEEFSATHDWDIFWLGGTYHVNPAVWHLDDLGRDAELTNHPHIIRTYGCWSTYAYIVRCESLLRVTRKLHELIPVSIGIDWSMIQMQVDLHAYAFAPGCAIQYDNRSDIGFGMTRFSGFSALGAHWFADRMENFDPTTYDWAEARR